ncbi:hypothetical protein BJ742DRAFT_734011 [Cladochytrium replicatum]|nr:hypothetical protein BJ742DRAFT_734011 [Cladochytrium replicatum]
MSNAKPVATAMEDAGTLMQTPLNDQEKKFPYREAVGCLMYAMLRTRTDLSYGVNEVLHNIKLDCFLKISQTQTCKKKGDFGTSLHSSLAYSLRIAGSGSNHESAAAEQELQTLIERVYTGAIP